MKNNKGMIILLVTLAILTLVTLVAMLFFFPKETPKPVAATETPATSTPLPDEFDPVEWTRNPQPTPLQTPSTPGTGDQGFTVTLPPATTPTTSTPATTPSLPPSPGASFPGDVPATKPAVVQSSPVTVETPKPKAPVTTPRTTPKVTKTVKVTEYWIQVASFKDRYQAENTSKALEAQGLKGTLTTATVNGQTVVRVRVGPYTNEAEAGKFLSWLKPVKEFEASYITKVSASHSAP